MIGGEASFETFPYSFSVRFKKQENFLGGMYSFVAKHDDGMRVYIDNNLIHDHWSVLDRDKINETFSSQISPGLHEIKVEYNNLGRYCCSAKVYLIGNRQILL